MIGLGTRFIVRLPLHRIIPAAIAVRARIEARIEKRQSSFWGSLPTMSDSYDRDCVARLDAIIAAARAMPHETHFPLDARSTLEREVITHDWKQGSAP